MGSWKGAWFLAKYEFNMIRWKHLLTVFFVAYTTMFYLPLYEDSIAGNVSTPMNWTLDFILITLLPVFGFISTQAWGFYWKTDPYSKKIERWRTMPISARQIALGRLLLLVMSTVIAVSLFFIAQYIILTMLDTQLDILSFILQSLFWISYAIIAGVIYVYFEQGHSGRVYFVMCAFFVIVLLAGSIAFNVLSDSSLVLRVNKTIQQGNAGLPIAAVAICLIVLRIGLVLIERRLKNRQF